MAFSKTAASSKGIQTAVRKREEIFFVRVVGVVLVNSAE
jgi:hypothetical protein